MSQPPNYPPPTSPYASSYSMSPAPRPSPLTTAAIVGLVLSIIGLMCNGFQLLAAVGQAALSKTVAMQNTPQLPGWVMGVSAVFSVVFLVLSIVWLAASIGLMKSSRWAYSAGTKIAGVQIAVLILWLGVSLILLAPETKRLADETMQRQLSTQKAPPPAGFTQGYSIGIAYGGPIIGFIFGLILPVTELICLTRPAVKTYFGEVSA